ncbi:magnesium transporter [Streptococcus pluranimalium]|uniref:magnesium transporter n=1 Tax=Streptococcus pluranimalium TaxID=82348 RepID=UPI00292E2662|nr:magnesium transporter [Streptococcus pluranimalium]HEM6116353.1 magnesium transporter [Streptococcus suis]
MSKNFSQDMAYMQAKFKTMPIADIVDYLKTLPEEERTIALTLLDKDNLAQVFSQFNAQEREAVLERLSQPAIKALIDELDSDDLVDVLQELPANMVASLLGHVAVDKRPIINHLLHYPNDSVGSLMNTDYVAVKAHQSKSEILAKIQNSPANPEHLHTIFIVDEERSLVGYLYLADLVRWREEAITELIQWNPISIWTRADREEAAQLFQKHFLLSLPVRDTENRLVGLITADDMFEVIAEEIHEDYSLMQGMGATDKPYLDLSVFTLARKRVVWLLLLMLSATVTGAIIDRYEAVLASTVALASYIPMLMDSGGNSGSQSSTLIIQSLALNEISRADSLKVLWKEFRVGLMVGGSLAIVNFLRMMLLTGDGVMISLVVSGTLLFTIVLAKLVGGILPILAKYLKQDPAVMAGPLVTTVVDACALVVYFQIASHFLGLGS